MPYRSKLPASGDGDPPERGPFTFGPLYTPHWALTLTEGCAMMSVLHGDCWVVRLEYDPARPTGELDEHGEQIYRLNKNAAGCRPPLIVAFGDPDESRESVESAFLDALCSAWCAVVLRFTGIVDPLEAMAGGVVGELEVADIWSGSEDVTHFDLLCMVQTCIDRHRDSDTHLPERVPDLVLDRFRRAVGYHNQTSLEEFFRAQIPIWRNQCSTTDRHQIRVPF